MKYIVNSLEYKTLVILNQIKRQVILKTQAIERKRRKYDNLSQGEKKGI